MNCHYTNLLSKITLNVFSNMVDTYYSELTKNN